MTRWHLAEVGLLDHGFRWIVDSSQPLNALSVIVGMKRHRSTGVSFNNVVILTLESLLHLFSGTGEASGLIVLPCHTGYRFTQDSSRRPPGGGDVGSHVTGSRQVVGNPLLRHDLMSSQCIRVYFPDTLAVFAKNAFHLVGDRVARYLLMTDAPGGLLPSRTVASALQRLLV